MTTGQKVRAARKLVDQTIQEYDEMLHDLYWYRAPNACRLDVDKKIIRIMHRRILACGLSENEFSRAMRDIVEREAPHQANGDAPWSFHQMTFAEGRI